MKKIFGIGVFVIVFSAIATFLVFFRDFSLFPFSLLERSDIRRYESILVSSHEVLRLNTVEHYYKFVFPHDFLDYTIDFSLLQRQAAQGYNLDAHERQQMSLFELCRKAGIPVHYGSRSFILYNVKVTAGFDFSGTIFENLDKTESFARDFFTDEDRIYLRLPLVDISSVELLHYDSGTEYSSNISLTADTYKELAEYVRNHSKTLAIADGILYRAEENGRYFLETVLLSHRYTKVIYID